MKGLIYKEGYLFFRSIEKRTLLIIAVIILFLIYQTGIYTGGIASVMLSMTLGMQMLVSSYHDEKTGWNQYQLTMPVSRYSVVASRYIFMLFVLALGVACSILVNLLISLMYGHWDSHLWGLSLAASAILPLLWFVVSMPLTYWFGYYTGKIMMFLFIFPMVYIMNFFIDGAKTLAMPNALFFRSLPVCIAAVCIVMFLLYVISYFISVAGYSRKK